MNDDLLLVLYIPILVVLLGAIYQIWRAWLEHKQNISNDCAHQFDRWDTPRETPHAYVQQRTCRLCGLTQTNQQQKFIA
jgi:hypothetical protein